MSLGTDDPINIKSAGAKSGAKIFTGHDGIPKSGNPFVEIATVPALGVNNLYAVAEVNIAAENPAAPDPTPDDASCANYGNLTKCPIFTTSIVNPSTLDPIQFALTPLKLIYRLHPSTFKKSPNQVFNSVIPWYQVDANDTPVPVDPCPAKDTLTGTGKPCVNNKQCYKNNAGDLANVCEYELISDRNGLTRFR